MQKIPNIIHFIFGLEPDFGGKPFGLMNYLAIKSAYTLNKPARIMFYYSYLPKGYWWEMARKYVTPVRIKAPTEIYGRPLMHFAHKADVVRLMVLIQFGGIYLDMDTICVKPFTDLLDNKFVIGFQGQPPLSHSLCNAVMLSQQGALFPRVWLKNYENFRSRGRDRYWCEHSVVLPARLAAKNSIAGECTIVPYNFFHYPLYNESELEMLFREHHHYDDAYCFHLWESFSYDKYLKNLTPDYIRTYDTTYNLAARPHLSIRKLPRFVKDLNRLSGAEKVF